MIITDFRVEHLAKAMELAYKNYQEEREKISVLPDIPIPDLTYFAENEMGVAAFDAEKMLGFLCGVSPFADAFQSTGIKGVFSPIHAHGAVKENRGRIYARLYQAAGEKWLARGALSHAVALYAHDEVAIRGFFVNGFGQRCADAIRALSSVESGDRGNCVFTELKGEQRMRVLPLENDLLLHYRNSSCFMKRELFTEQTYARRLEELAARVFVAQNGDEIVAFAAITDEGETFVSTADGMMNICGAYCLPGYRGKGIYHALIGYLTDTLKNEGYTRLGVDYESINPTAQHFWPKLFAPYTRGVVRRIDDKMLSIV